MEELNVYSGTLNYKDIVFEFVFDKQDLRLIPPSDKNEEVQHWKMNQLFKGVYTTGNPLTIDVPYLEGVTNETNQNIIFITSITSFK